MNPFPLEPFATAAGVTLGQIGGQPRRHDGDPATGYAELGALLEVSRTTLRRWRSTGLTLAQADELAMRLGLMPHEVWDRWYAVSAAQGAAAVNAGKTHCPQGHPYTHTNGRGERVCRYCSANNLRRFRAKAQATATISPAQEVQHAC